MKKLVKIGTVALAAIACTVIVVGMAITFQDELAIMSSQVKPDTKEVVSVGALDIQLVENGNELKNNGYVNIRFNETCKNDGYTYIAWVYSKGNECVNYQFTVNQFTDWVMMPLPFSNQHIVVVKQLTEDYKESFNRTQVQYNKLKFRTIEKAYTVNTLLVGSYEISNAGNYKENLNCINGKTVWVTWEDDSIIKVTADQLRASSKDDYEFMQNAMAWIHENIAYDYGKLNNRSNDKYYGLVARDKTIENRLGVCTDMAGLLCAMARSQGIPCQYITGQVPKADGTLGFHAWNRYMIGESWDGCDPTINSNAITVDYIEQQSM